MLSYRRHGRYCFVDTMAVTIALDTRSTSHVDALDDNGGKTILTGVQSETLMKKLRLHRNSTTVQSGLNDVHVISY